MYVKPDYAERELPVMHDMIEAARFGLLVLCAGGPLAAHIPFVLHRDQGVYGTLVAHVARIDPLARYLGAAHEEQEGEQEGHEEQKAQGGDEAQGGHEALAIFSGPKAYVSPRWYQDDGLPTYNFLAVHAHGRPRLLQDRDTVLAYLTELVDVHERRFSSPWSLASAAEEHVDELLPHIVAFTLEIASIQGKRKLSQNKSAEDRAGVIRGLSERGSDDDRAIVEAMTDNPEASQG
jgi:transcriptional regulator